MKHFAIAVAVLTVAIAIPSHSYAGDQKFCSKSAEAFAAWVANARVRLKGGTALEEFGRLHAQQAQFQGIANKMSNRAARLLESSATEGEARADLYALCMSNS